MYKSKKEEGITLIALVITIIILVILAAISIQALTNTGLFAKANDAKTKTEIAREIEQIKLSITTVITYNYESGNIPYADFYDEMTKYKDVKSVTPADDIDSSLLISKAGKKFNLSNLFMPVSNAADANEDSQFAKVEYKTGRIYYVKLKNGNKQPNDKIGSIYKDPNNDPSGGSTSGGSGGTTGGSGGTTGDTSGEDKPEATLTSWFTYEYFNAQDYFEQDYGSDYNGAKTLDELNNYFETNNWENSGQKDYLTAKKYNGYIITGFTEDGKQALLNGTLKNTMYIPSKYNDGTNGEANVIALASGMSSEYASDWVDDTERNIFQYVKKIYIPSTVVSLGFSSLTCVTAYGTEIKYNGTPNIKYIETFAFGDTNPQIITGGTVGEKYIEIPDSVEILGVENQIYYCNYYSLGKNIKTLVKDNNTTIGASMTDNSYAGYNLVDIAFFRGSINDLNGSETFTTYDIFENQDYEYDENRATAYNNCDVMYCLDGDKIVIQEKSGDKFIWKEITRDNLKTNIINVSGIEDSEAQQYIDAISNIINKAKTIFK